MYVSTIRFSKGREQKDYMMLYCDQLERELKSLVLDLRHRIKKCAGVRVYI
jgi:hypothetical protein